MPCRVLVQIDSAHVAHDKKMTTLGMLWLQTVSSNAQTKPLDNPAVVSALAPVFPVCCCRAKEHQIKQQQRLHQGMPMAAAKPRAAVVQPKVEMQLQLSNPTWEATSL